MSPPDPDEFLSELINNQLLKVTPPFVPVVFVQRVMSPLDVSSLRGAADVPALVVMRPTDLTRIPPRPAVMLAFSAVVEAVAVNLTLSPAVKLAVVVMPEQVMIRSLETLIAPPEFPNVPEPPQFKVSDLSAVSLEILVETVIAPPLSICTLPVAKAFCRTVLLTMAGPSVFDSKTPLTMAPVVVPVLIVTELAKKLGVTFRLVPTKESEVKVSV
jgi:hypothetical protein